MLEVSGLWHAHVLEFSYVLTKTVVNFLFTLLAASISHFSHHRYEIFIFFFQRYWSPLFLVTCSSSFSVIYA